MKVRVSARGGVTGDGETMTSLFSNFIQTSTANATRDEYMANDDDTGANNRCTGRKHWIMFSLCARACATSYANEKEKEAPAANASPSADGFALAAFLA